MADLITVTGDRVHLADDWRDRIDPRSLPTAVTAAIHRATTDTTATADTAWTAPDLDGHPIKAMLAAFSRQVASLDDRPEWVDSHSGHVAASSLHGLVREFEIDAKWASSAPTSEVESELTEVLTLLRHSHPYDPPHTHPS